jgi:hypothetical protein
MAPCICVTFASSVNNQTFNICLPGNVTVPYNNNATLAGNDILRFILFSNPSDTLGSIIVQGGSPDIAFNPAIMQTGVTYTTPNGTFKQTFSSNTNTFQVCTPVNSAAGSFQLTATLLVDGWCSCN